jgi:Arc/MetJ family transcription regulator
MRANIDIDDELMARAMRTTGLSTRSAVVETALRWLLDSDAGAGRQDGGAANIEPHHQTDATSLSRRQVELDLFAACMGFAAPE